MRPSSVGPDLQVPVKLSGANQGGHRDSHDDPLTDSPTAPTETFRRAEQFSSFSSLIKTEHDASTNNRDASTTTVLEKNFQSKTFAGS